MTEGGGGGRWLPAVAMGFYNAPWAFAMSDRSLVWIQGTDIIETLC